MPDKFFEDVQGAAVLKHAILTEYLPVFVGKTGKYSKGKRVAYLDAYAGAGAYESGAPGSPTLAAQTAERLAAYRSLECFMIEKDPPIYEQLCSNLDSTEGCTIYLGTMEEHADDIASQTAGCPMFSFFDPFGLLLPMSFLQSHYLSRPRRTGATTEVLLTFSLPGLWRNAGWLKELETDHEPSHKAQITILNKVDATLNGDWWRDIWLANESDRDEQILRGYVQRLTDPEKWGWWYVGVSDRWEGPVVYFLIFLTQHPDGIWTFHESLSLAHEQFFEYTHRDTTPTLEDDPEYRKRFWIDTIKRNIEGLIASEPEPFTPRSRIREIFGDALLFARGTHLRAAIKELHKEGKTATTGTTSKKKGDPELQDALILPP